MTSPLFKKIFYSSIAFYLVLFPFLFVNFNWGVVERSPPEKTPRIEYSSSNVPDIDLSQLPGIDYADLYSQWYDPKIEMLIVAPDDQNFVNELEPLAEWKNKKGVKTEIVSKYTQYEGTDAQERIRNLIKDYYEYENLQWVLLAGDTELIPIREVYNPDVIIVSGNDEYPGFNEYYKPTDFYYADLTGSWDDNENGKWGESAVYTKKHDEIDWSPEVYVGRFPADDANELQLLVNKTLKYETNPYIGNWTNQMLLAGGVSTISPPEDEARLTSYIWEQYAISEMNFTHLPKTTPSYDPPTPPSPNKELPLSRPNFINEFNKGYSTVIFAGHGLPTKFNDMGVGDVYLNSDASSSGNINMPSLVYGDACSTNSYDQGDYSVGETLIMRKDAGAIGYVGGLRVTWYFEEDTNLEMLNRGNAKLFWKAFFEDQKFQQGKALYDSKVDYMTSDYFARKDASMSQEWERKNVLTYCLLGDPELDIYTNSPINASNPVSGRDLYEGQEVELKITDANGKTVPNARVHLNTADGKYRTEYANNYGEVSFRLTAQVNETYNVTITGHNLVPSYFNFTTIPDELNPEVLDVEWEPEDPTVSDNIRFTVDADDQQSGVEGVFLLISDNNFEDYFYERLNNNDLDAENTYKDDIDKLDPGEYTFLIVARDYTNNLEIMYNSRFIISIPTPMTDYILNVMIFFVAGVAGASIILTFVGRKKYLRMAEKLTTDQARYSAFKEEIKKIIEVEETESSK